MTITLPCFSTKGAEINSKDQPNTNQVTSELLHPNLVNLTSIENLCRLVRVGNPLAIVSASAIASLSPEEHTTLNILLHAFSPAANPWDKTKAADALSTLAELHSSTSKERNECASLASCLFDEFSFNDFSDVVKLYSLDRPVDTQNTSIAAKIFKKTIIMQHKLTAAHGLTKLARLFEEHHAFKEIFVSKAATLFKEIGYYPSGSPINTRTASSAGLRKLAMLYPQDSPKHQEFMNLAEEMLVQFDID
jgi:hypothetical protein